jgi:isopentenyl-diphosphate delta-isomerase
LKAEIDSQLILLDEDNNEVGFLDKLSVHQQGHFHRAFSVLIYDGKNVLIHRRAQEKYHCGGLWSNTCCGHPSQSNDIRQQAEKRLFEEMGFNCELQFLRQYQYHAHLDNELIENELVDIFVGRYDGEITPNTEEVEAFEWVDIGDLQENVIRSPETYTPWFRLYCRDVLGSGPLA